MSTGERAYDALFPGAVPPAFRRHVVQVAEGQELGAELCRLPDAIVVVEAGELELECQAGGRRRFGAGSMIPIARVPLAHARNVGPGPLVLVCVSRAALRAGDEFPRAGGSYSDC